MTVTLLVMVALPLLLIMAAIWDLTSYTIPNALPIGIALLFIPFAVLSPMGWSAFGLHLLIGIAALAVGIIFFSLHWIGGGDAKLYAACALWFGLKDILSFTLISALAGGVLGILLLLFRQVTLPLAIEKITWIHNLNEKNAGIPYGVALTAGFLIWLPHSGLIAYYVS